MKILSSDLIKNTSKEIPGTDRQLTSVSIPSCKLQTSIMQYQSLLSYNKNHQTFLMHFERKTDAHKDKKHSTGCANKKQSPRETSIYQQWQLIWFNRYNSLSFKVHFFKWTCSCTLNIHESWIKLCATFRQHFKRFSDECQLPARYLNRVFKMTAALLPSF